MQQLNWRSLPLRNHNADTGEEGEGEGAEDEEGEHGVEGAFVAGPDALEVEKVKGEGEKVQPGGPDGGPEELGPYAEI